MASDFHALEAGFTPALELRIYRFENAGDVCPDKLHRPFEHGVVEKGVVPDFHTVEVCFLFLVLKVCPFCYEIYGNVCRDELRRPCEHRIVKRGVFPDFHAAEVGAFFLVLKLGLLRGEQAGDVC